MDEMFTCTGKQVLKQGTHYADACTPHAAEMICIMLNRGRLFSMHVTEAEAAAITKGEWS